MVWLPTDREVVLKLASPPDRVTLDARTVAPSLKVTVPVGAPAAGPTAETKAMKATGSPRTDAPETDASEVEVPPWLTT